MTCKHVGLAISLTINVAARTRAMYYCNACQANILPPSRIVHSLPARPSLVTGARLAAISLRGKNFL